MLATLRGDGLPDDDREAGDVLSGVESLLAVGLADPQRLFLFGHSYGAYLLNRILTVDHRFRAVVEHAGMVWRWYSAQARVADGTEDRRWRVLAGHRRCVAAARCGFRHRGSRREYLGAGWRTGSYKDAQVRCTRSRFRLLPTTG
jgi:Prolyl oligopeptidase family